MPAYIGNDYILSIALNEREVTFKLVHEKDNTCADIQKQDLLGTACIYNAQSEVLIYGYGYTLMTDELYKSVDNQSVFFTPCIIKDYNQLHFSESPQKKKNDFDIDKVFWVYLKILIKDIYNHFKSRKYQITKLLHWVFAVPDKWSTKIIEIKEQVIDTGLNCIEDANVIQHSHALLSYLQLPHYSYSLVNGEFYIICLFTEFNEVTVYSYEIGPPIKGLNNIANHTTKFVKTFKVKYIDEQYLLDILFGGNKDEAKRFNLDIKKLMDLCFGNYWIIPNPHDSLYELALYHADSYLSEVDKSFFEEKKAELSGVTLKSIQLHPFATVENVEKVIGYVSLLAKHHYSVKVVVMRESFLTCEYDFMDFTDQLAYEIHVIYHNYNVFGHQSYAIGAAHFVQNQLRIKNYLPQVVDSDRLDCIANGNVLYINVEWESNSIVFVNSKKEKTIIRNTSKEIEFGYTINECFVFKDHEHQFRIPDMTITEKCLEMMQLSEEVMFEVLLGIQSLNNALIKAEENVPTQHEEEPFSIHQDLNNGENPEENHKESPEDYSASVNQDNQLSELNQEDDPTVNDTQFINNETHLATNDILPEYNYESLDELPHDEGQFLDCASCGPLLFGNRSKPIQTVQESNVNVDLYEKINEEILDDDHESAEGIIQDSENDRNSNEGEKFQCQLEEIYEEEVKSLDIHSDKVDAANSETSINLSDQIKDADTHHEMTNTAEANQESNNNVDETIEINTVFEDLPPVIYRYEEELQKANLNIQNTPSIDLSSHLHDEYKEGIVDTNKDITPATNQELRPVENKPDRSAVENLSAKEKIQLLDKYYISENSILSQCRVRSARRNLLPMMYFYLDMLQVYIKEYLISKGAFSRSESIECYFSIDQSILEKLSTSYDYYRNIFLAVLKNTHPTQPMKLIHLGQMTGVHCKEVIKCHNRVENYLEYPQYMVQVHLNPTYIDLTLNAIMALKHDINSTEDETEILIKRKRLPFNMVDIIAETIWTHIKSMDDCSIHTCSYHTVSDYEDDLDMYLGFKEYFNEYFTEHYSMDCNNGLMDWYKLVDVRMNRDCDCTYSLAPIDIFDICIEPAINQLTASIYSATVNPFIFGKYKTHHIIIMGTIMKLNCASTYNQMYVRFQEKISYEQKYHKHITIHWVQESLSTVLENSVNSIVNNPLGGLLEQAASGTYSISFDKKAFRYNEEWSHLNPYNNVCIFFNKDRILERFREEGFIVIYFFRDDEVNLNLFFQANGEEYTNAKSIKFFQFEKAYTYPIVIRGMVDIDQVTFRFHSDGERDFPLKFQNTGVFTFSESTLLIPFV